MKSYRAYANYAKPAWAPPSWLFGPVWSVLYLIIAVSFGYVFYLYAEGVLPLFLVLPFGLNLIFNFAYTPLQFRLKSFALASLDILLVLATLVWALLAIYPFLSWVAYANLPYLVWVCFASVLQLTITLLNAPR